MISLYPQRFSRVNLHKMQTHLLVRKNKTNMKTNTNSNYIYTYACASSMTPKVHMRWYSQHCAFIMVLQSYLYIAACISNKNVFSEKNLQFLQGTTLQTPMGKWCWCKEKTDGPSWEARHEDDTTVVGQGDSRSPLPMLGTSYHMEKKWKLLGYLPTKSKTPTWTGFLSFKR